MLLQQERETLQSIIDCMADVVIFASPDGRLLLRNRASDQLYPQGVPTGDLHVCHDSAVWDRLLAKLANPGPKENHPVLNVDGHAFEATYARVCGPDGTLRGVVMVARDITERLQTQAWRMQEERMAVVGRLAAGLAHELNNPLSCIALFTQQAIKRASDDAPLREYLGTVLRNANQCAKIVKDLLVYARQRAPEKRATDAVELLRDVIRTVDASAAAANVKVVLAWDGTPSTYTLDPDQMRQVLVNLALNGIDSMDGGGTLELRCARTADALLLAVKDTGCGIPAADLELIFRPFFTTKATGTGLGLAVAQDIVHAHGGVITPESAAGCGTTFTVSLPLKTAELEVI